MLQTLNFDFDCVKWFNDTWQLSHQKIVINSGSFDFSEQKRTLFPLNGVDLSRKDVKCAPWKIAYMAAKHNRINEFSECTLFRLLEAMAALYLLNIVFTGEIVLIEEHLQYPNELESNIFEPGIFYETNYGAVQGDRVTCIYELEDWSNEDDNEVIIPAVRTLKLLGIETASKKR